jgi:hypothetical protein
MGYVSNVHGDVRIVILPVKIPQVDALVLAGELGGAEERKACKERLGSVPNEVGVVPLSNLKPFKPEVSADFAI